MYKSKGPEDFRRQYNLPEDYTVSGMLAVGTWDKNAADRHLPYLERTLDTLQIDAPILKLQPRFLQHAYEFTVEGENYWYVPVMGTAVMAQYAHVASVLGSQKNIVLGTAGGLTPGMCTGDLIVPTHAEGNDNAAKYQSDAPDRLFKPDGALRESLLGRLSTLAANTDLPIWDSKITTNEMVLAQTEADVENWAQAGFGGVEMETALVFAISNHFEVPSAASLMVLDNLAAGETFMDPNFFAEPAVARHAQARHMQYMASTTELLGTPLPYES